MGGWTSIQCCLGNQNVFSVSLSHDAAISPNEEDNNVDISVPTYMLMSEGFLGVMMPMIYKCKD